MTKEEIEQKMGEEIAEIKDGLSEEHQALFDLDLQYTLESGPVKSAFYLYALFQDVITLVREVAMRDVVIEAITDQSFPMTELNCTRTPFQFMNPYETTYDKALEGLANSGLTDSGIARFSEAVKKNLSDSYQYANVVQDLKAFFRGAGFGDRVIDPNLMGPTD